MIDSNFYIGIITINITIITFYLTAKLAWKSFLEQRAIEITPEVLAGLNEIDLRLFKEKISTKEKDKYEESFKYLIDLVQGNMGRYNEEIKGTIFHDIHSNFYFIFQSLHSKIELNSEPTRVSDFFTREMDTKNFENIKKLKQALAGRRLNIERTLSIFTRYIYFNDRSLNDILNIAEERIKNKPILDFDGITKDSRHIKGMQKELHPFSDDLLGIIRKLDEIYNFSKSAQEVISRTDIITLSILLMVGLIVPLFSILYSSIISNFPFLEIVICPLLSLSSLVFIIFSAQSKLTHIRHTKHLKSPQNTV